MSNKWTKKLSKELEAQECDARNDDSRSTAGYIK